MFAPPCLDGGLLIDAEYIIVRPQRCTFPAASIQIDDGKRQPLAAYRFGGLECMLLGPGEGGLMSMIG